MESKLKAAAMESVGERTEFTPSIINKRFPDSFIPENAKVTAIKFGDKVATCVEELPNLLLREGGYPHLPTTPIKQEPELTDWFDGAKFVPAHVGVFEVDNAPWFVTVYQHWNGKFWGAYASNPDRALAYSECKSDYQNLEWRGIKK